MGDISPLRSGPDPATGPSSGYEDGGNIEGRLTALETRLEYLATKEDVQELKTWILGGFIATIVVVATLLVGIAKLFL